ncbi:hypothetical protein HY745_01945 [Candidatus Desantisbacteria bacterium]|nr:hypothetical protein [Candidatus Desantisbacteria bacterium]
MIKKIVKKYNLNDSFQIGSDMKYWLTKSPQERIAAIEILRRQYNGSTERLQKIVRVIQRKQS